MNRFGNVQHQGTLNKAIRRIIRDCNDEVLMKGEIDRLGLDVKIEVDGGVCPDNARRLIDVGAEILVAGSAVFKAENPAEVIAALR